MTTGRHRPTAATTLRIALGFVVALVVYTGTALVWLIAGGPGPLPLWLVAVSTVVLAGLLSAGAEVIDRVVDRLTLGSADPSAVHALLRRMGQSLPVDEVLPRLAEATSRSLGQSRAEVEVLLAHGVTRAQVWPPSAPLGAPGLTVSVTHAGAPVGRMTIEIDGLETDPVQRRLLGDLIGPAGIALATVRLTDDLRERREELSRTTAQLRRANQRLLAARRGERERLRVQVDRRVQADLQRALDDLARPEGRAPHWVEHALDEMRSIARGIYPPRLDEAGLAVALLGWCARRGVVAVVEVGVDVQELLVVHPAVRTCLYFCAVTLFDVAAGSRIECLTEVDTVTMRLLGMTDLRAAEPALQVCRDRVEAFDGELRATADTVTVRLPVPGDEP